MLLKPQMQTLRASTHSSRLLPNGCVFKASAFRSSSISHLACRAPQRCIERKANGEEFHGVESTEELPPGVTEPNGCGLDEESLLLRIIVPYVTSFGEGLRAVGDLDDLGAWDVENGRPLEWNEGHVWTMGMDLHKPVPEFEFKLVVISPSGCRWEQGSNRVVQLGPDLSSVTGVASIELRCTFDVIDSTETRVLVRASALRDPIEQSKARLELQGSKRSKLQALLSEAQDAYRDALAEISKSWESQAADRAFMIVQELGAELEVLEQDTTSLQSNVEQATALLKAFREGGLVELPSEPSGKVLVPGLLSQSLRTTKDLSSGLPSPSAAAASAVEAAAAAAASIADSSSSRSRTYSSDVLFEQARPAIGKGLALPPPLLLESLKSLGRGTGPAPPSPSHRPDPPQAPKSPSFPAYHDQATQASPSSDSMSDAAASGDQGLMAVVPPAQDKAGTGNEGSGHSSSGVEPNFISFVTLLRCLGDLGYLAYLSTLGSGGLAEDGSSSSFTPSSEQQQEVPSPPTSQRAPASLSPGSLVQQQQQQAPDKASGLNKPGAKQQQHQQQQQQQARPAQVAGSDEVVERLQDAGQEPAATELKVSESSGEKQAAAPPNFEPTPEPEWLAGGNGAAAGSAEGKLPGTEDNQHDLSNMDRALKDEIDQAERALGEQDPEEDGGMRRRRALDNGSGNLGEDSSSSVQVRLQQPEQLGGRLLQDGSIFFTSEGLANTEAICFAQESLRPKPPQTSPIVEQPVRKTERKAINA